MKDFVLFIGSLLLSFTGVVWSSYNEQRGKSLQWLYEQEKRFLIDKDEKVKESFYRQYGLWSIGKSFNSPVFQLIGIILCLGSGGLVVLHNKWWSAIIVILGGVLLFRMLVWNLKKHIQALSLITLIVSVSIIIYAIVD